MRGQTFNVALEELGQDAVGSQLVKHAAEKLLGYACYIPWDQHAADQEVKKKKTAKRMLVVTLSLRSSRTTRTL